MAGTGSATQIDRTVPGDRFYFDFYFNGDTSYPSGGYPINAASFWGLSVVTEVIPLHYTAGMASGFADFQYDPTTGKLMLFTAAGSQVAGSTDASSVKIRVQVHGG